MVGLMKNTKNANKARQPKLIFDGPDYSISEIPRNYRIFIKFKLKKLVPNNAINREIYSGLDRSIKEVHEVAKDYIAEHFVTGY